MDEPVPTTPTTDEVLEHMRERWRFASSEGDARAARSVAVQTAAALVRDCGAQYLDRAIGRSNGEGDRSTEEHVDYFSDLTMRVADRLTRFILTGVDPAAPEGTDD